MVQESVTSVLLQQYDLSAKKKRTTLLASYEMTQCQSPSYYEMQLPLNQSFVSGFQLLLFSNKTMLQLDSPGCDVTSFYQVRFDVSSVISTELCFLTGYFTQHKQPQKFFLTYDFSKIFFFSCCCFNCLFQCKLSSSFPTIDRLCF
jgi:hypothetical protein